MSQGCGFSVHLFNRSTDIVSKAKVCAQTAGKITIPHWWYIDVLAVTSVTVNGLQTAKEQMDK